MIKMIPQHEILTDTAVIIDTIERVCKFLSIEDQVNLWTVFTKKFKNIKEQWEDVLELQERIKNRNSAILDNI